MYQAQLFVNIADVSQMSKKTADIDAKTIAIEFLVQWLLILPNILSCLFALLWLFVGDTLWDNIKLIFSRNWFEGIKFYDK